MNLLKRTPLVLVTLVLLLGIASATVAINSPLDRFITVVTEVNFSANISGTAFIKNVSLFGDFNGTFSENSTATLETAGETLNFSSGSATDAFNKTWVAMTFTVGNVGPNTAMELSKISLGLTKTGTPLGTVNVSIRATDANGNVSGSDLSQGNIPASSVAGGFGNNYNITMSPLNLSVGTKYAIIVSAPQPANSLSNDVAWVATFGTDTYTGGGRATSSDSGSTWTLSTNDTDMRFTIFAYLNKTITNIIFAQNVTRTTRWNIRACYVDNTCEFSTANRTIGYRFIENSQTFNNITLSGQTESFLLNITYNSTFFPALTSVLVYNNTQYSPTQSGTGDNLVFNATITVPSVSAQTAKQFYWQLTFVNGSGSSFIGNTTFYNQTINTIGLDNCGSFTNQILNFSLFDEDQRVTPINGTIEIIATLYNSQRSAISGQFNSSTTVTSGSTARVCANTLNGTFSLDYQAKYYGNSSYVVEYKFAQAIPVTNTTTSQNIQLYDLLATRSTAFVITLTSPDLSTIAGAVIDVQRQYIPLNQFISVESPLTDSLGTAIAHLVSQEIYYNFVVTKNGTVIGTFNNKQVQCQNVVTSDCRIDLNLVQSVPAVPDFQDYGNITSTFTWSPTTRTLYFTFVSSDSLTHIVAWNVTKADNFGNTTICTNSVTSASGTFTCVIPTLYGNSSIIAYLYSDGVYLGANSFSFADTPDDIWGGTKVILGILMYGTLTLMMIAHPAMLIIGAMIGMGLVAGFHIVDGGSFIGNTAIILWFIIAGAILIYYMRNKI